MNIDILPAREGDFTVVQNLVRFYVYDMSEHMGWECPETGLFGGCDDLPQYWGREPDDPLYRWSEPWQGFPFIVRADGRLAGFVLIRRLDKDGAGTNDVGEFFILRKYRGKGIGTLVAHRLFDTFPGAWQVREMVGNAPAIAFWRKVIAEYADGDYCEERDRLESHGLDMVVQRFSSRTKEPGAGPVL